MSNWVTQSFRPPSDNSSYFDKAREDAVEKLRHEINQQVRNEANTVIHNIVTQKDTEISNLRDEITELEAKLAAEKGNIKIEKVEVPSEYEKGELSAEFAESDDLKTINNAFYRAIKYGESTEDDLKDEHLYKLRGVMVSWKNFFEEYKWKSNYISNKIKKLLKDTDSML